MYNLNEREMRMQVRLFYNDFCKDIPLDGKSKFSIGSGKNDGFCLSDSDLKKNHVVLTTQKNGWQIVCNGDTFLRGATLKKGPLQMSVTYVLSQQHRVSMICMDDSVLQVKSLNLGIDRDISVGRDQDNDIVLQSPLVSGRHAVIKKVGSRYYIQDSGSTNGTYLNETRVNESPVSASDRIVIGPFSLVFHGTSLEILSAGDGVQIHSAQSPARVLSADVDFVRSPRLKLEVPTGTVEIEAPPAVTGKPELNLASLLLPVIGTVGVAIATTAISGNSRMMLYTLPMTLIGLVVSIINYRKQKRGYSSQMDVRLEKYTEHLDRIVATIEAKQKEQRNALLASDPDLSACFEMAGTVDRKLWDRKPMDSDFMSVRLGTGKIPASFEIRAPKEAISLEDDELKKRPEEIQQKYCTVSNAPIICSILENQVCGVVGSNADTFRLTKNIVAQIAAHHYYGEVKMVFIYDENDRNNFDWTQRLPHTLDDDRSGHLVATNRVAAEKLFNAVADAMKIRKLEMDEEGNFGAVSMPLPYYLFVIAQPAFLGRNDSITEYLFRNRKLNAGVLLVVENMIQLPKECNLIIEVDGRSGKMFHRENATLTQAFIVDNAEANDFERFADSLSHIICEEGMWKKSIPQKFSFFEMMKIQSASEVNPGLLWAESDATKSLAAPIGVGNGKEILLDLHEKAHGPHGLVAGTTGSGKSELLQSYILAMAMRYHPHEVAFVIIDFKGGGMANQFKELPHLVGSITNMEGRAVNRSLASIKAELMKRQRLFAEANVNNIDKYIEKYKHGEVSIPLPHLIIVVDEFAELKADQPEFMKELISAARIGRSLGIHLILATQKPAGQVNEQIWSNSKFKICLKVATREDSNEVIKSALAFKIKEPGRAYLQVGNNEVFELFQSGYSGGVVERDLTQLDVLVEKLASYCRENEIQKLPPICCEPLPEIVLCPDASAPKEFGEIGLGILDAPDEQYQGVTTINLAKDNTLIIGTAQTGKTNLIQSAIHQLARAYTPDDINFYMIDLGAMTLRVFESLHHTGGVVTVMEEEKLKNLFKLLFEELERRKRLFSKNGVGSFAAYREVCTEQLALIVVFVDNLGVFKDAFGEQYEDMLIRLLREGLTYGISFVITSSQTGGLSYKYLTSIGTRIALPCNDSNEYSYVLERCRMEPSNVPGRALTAVHKGIYEVQTFMAFAGGTEAARSSAIRDFVQEMNEIYPDMSARKIPEVPERLTSDFFAQNCANIPVRDEIPFAVDYNTVNYVALNCYSQFMLTLAGKNNVAKERFVAALMENIGKSYFKRPVELYIIDGFDRKLGKYKDDAFVRAYATSPDALGDILEDVCGTLEDRLDKLEDSKGYSLGTEPWIIILINNKRALDVMADNDSTEEFFNKIARKYSAMKILFLLTDIDDTSIRSSAPAICRKVRDDKKILYFGSLKEIKMIDVYSSSIRNLGDLSAEDDAYLFEGEEIRRVKTVQEV